MIYFDGIIYSWQKGGGVHRYFQKLISFTSEKEINSTLLIQEPSYGALPLKSAYVSVKRIGPSTLSRLPGRLFSTARKFASPLNKLLMERYFKNITAGIFHSTYYTTYNSLNIPQVLTVHDMTYEKFPELYGDTGSKRFIRRKKLCIDKADAIICVSNATKDSLRQMYDVPEEKISVIHHGVDEFFSVDESEVAAKPFLLFVGNRSKYKNFNFFLETFATWDRREKYEVIVAGGGDFTDAEKALIARLGITNHIQKLGYVGEAELRTLYRTCKTFVFPSLDEGFGLPILEAICCGARVLASDIPAFREIGLDIPRFFDPRDAASLTAALDEIMNVPELTPKEKTEKARMVREKFNWDRSLGATLEVYESLER